MKKRKLERKLAFFKGLKEDQAANRALQIDSLTGQRARFRLVVEVETVQRQPGFPNEMTAADAADLLREAVVEHVCDGFACDGPPFFGIVARCHVVEAMPSAKKPHVVRAACKGD